MYPIRFSKEKWRIPISPPINIIDINNMEKLNNIKGIDDIVLYSEKLIINICFPLTNYATFELHIDTGHLTRRELLITIYDLYNQVYDMEEVTSTPTTYSLTPLCDSCYGCKPYEDAAQTPGENPAQTPGEKCPICFELNNDIKLIRCQHTFHKTCIDKWLTTNPTCPLCRTRVYPCSHEPSIYTAVVIPREHRPDAHRNTTDGLFGIYLYDLDNLVLEDIFFNKDGTINMILNAV